MAVNGAIYDDNRIYWKILSSSYDYTNPHPWLVIPQNNENSFPETMQQHVLFPW